MSVLVVENYEGTGLGQIGPVLDEAGLAVDLRRPYAGEALPADAGGHKALIVLGGEQNALADGDYPYFPHLLGLIRAFGGADKAVLGICLGSQLVARAYGGTNILDRPLEFGWREVRLTDAGRDDPVLSSAGAAFPIFHWHHDTFALPQGAVHMAASDMTPHQAYRIGRAVYGTQFHFEADRRLVAEWNARFADGIARFAPEWDRDFPALSERFGPAADRAGAALARAWIGRI